MVKIKFCGLKREEDVEKAVLLGVDYLGFILYPKSPRYVDIDRLKDLLKFSKTAKKVGVFVNPSYQEVKEVLDLGIDYVQLHGEESLEFAKSIGLERVIKAFRVKDKLEIDHVWKQTYAILLDTYHKEFYGGTGKTFDWDIAKEALNRGFRVFLSGGLNAKNVSLAIKKVKPYAVDVSSGIELSPGVKDHKKMEEFVNAVKNAS